LSAWEPHQRLSRCVRRRTPRSARRPRMTLLGRAMWPACGPCHRLARSDVVMLRERPALTRAAGVQTSRHVTPMSQLSATMEICPSL
jgi:hypothetical protein